MKRNLVVFLGLIVLMLIANAAMAGTYSQRVHRRQVVQRARIQAGWRQGDLTRAEMWRLRSGQWRIRRAHWRAHHDGSLNRWERIRLERMQDRENARIYRLRHNHRERWL